MLDFLFFIHFIEKEIHFEMFTDLFIRCYRHLNHTKTLFDVTDIWNIEGLKIRKISFILIEAPKHQFQLFLYIQNS